MPPKRRLKKEDAPRRNLQPCDDDHNYETPFRNMTPPGSEDDVNTAESAANRIRHNYRPNKLAIKPQKLKLKPKRAPFTREEEKTCETLLSHLKQWFKESCKNLNYGVADAGNSPVRLSEVSACIKEEYKARFENVHSYNSLLEGIKKDLPDHVCDLLNPYPNVLEIMDKLTAWICTRHEEFSGHYIGVGSHHDKTKVGQPSEFDFLYEFHNIDFKVKANDQNSGCYSVIHGDSMSRSMSDLSEPFRGSQVVMSDNFYLAFSHVVDEALFEMQLPPRMSHAGFCSPRYSGVRKCGPAVSIPIYYDYGTAEMLVKIDITPALPIPLARVADKIPWPSPVRSFIRNNMINCVHLVPCDRRHFWKVSTAHLEHLYLDNLAKDGKVRRTIRTVKALKEKYLAVHCLSGWGEQTKMERKMADLEQKFEAQKEIVSAYAEHFSDLDKILELMLYFRDQYQTTADEEEAIDDLLMKHILHRWSAIDPLVLARWHEICEPYVTIRSCVVKYTVLNMLFNGQIRDSDPSDPSTTLIHSILEAGSKESIKHAFLGTDIRTKQVSLYAQTRTSDTRVENWVDFHNELCSAFLEKLKSLMGKGRPRSRSFSDIQLPGGAVVSEDCCEEPEDHPYRDRKDDFYLQLSGTRRQQRRPNMNANSSWRRCGPACPHQGVPGQRAVVGTTCCGTDCRLVEEQESRIAPAKCIPARGCPCMRAPMSCPASANIPNVCGETDTRGCPCSYGSCSHRQAGHARCPRGNTEKHVVPFQYNAKVHDGNIPPCGCVRMAKEAGCRFCEETSQHLAHLDVGWGTATHYPPQLLPPRFQRPTYAQEPMGFGDQSVYGSFRHDNTRGLRSGYSFKRRNEPDMCPEHEGPQCVASEMTAPFVDNHADCNCREVESTFERANSVPRAGHTRAERLSSPMGNRVDCTDV